MCTHLVFMSVACAAITNALDLCGYNASKKGVVTDTWSKFDLAAFAGPDTPVRWVYDWGSYKEFVFAEGQFYDLGFEYWPMVFAGDQVYAGATHYLDNLAPKSGPILLGYNEPNFEEQGNMFPEDAASLWPQVEAIAAATGMQIASPALNFCGGIAVCVPGYTNTVNPWLDQFFGNCTEMYGDAGCKVDYIAFHTYTCGLGGLQYFVDLYSGYGYPIIVSEFGCGDDIGINTTFQIDYMRQAVEYMEGDDRVYAYAWFAGRTDQFNTSLLNTDGNLTDVGMAYMCLDEMRTQFDTWDILLAAGIPVDAASISYTALARFLAVFSTLSLVALLM